MRVERIGECELWLGDCRELLGEIPEDAAIVSDVPYGMNWDTDSTRFSGGNRITRGSGRADWGEIASDNAPFDPDPWLGFRECVLWGANHYSQRLPVGTTLIWLKKPQHLFGTFLSDAEIGWMNKGHGVYCHYEQFPPPSRIAEHDGKSPAHPTQKPIGLMRWCIQKTKADTIVDPYMGSGSTALAAIDEDRRFIGIELDEKHFETACRRIEVAYRQPRLFAEPAPKPQQMALVP